MNEEIFQGFITEGQEALQSSLQCVHDLEINSEDVRAINDIFRCFHSLKGNAAMLGLNGISSFAHAAENALDKIRKGQIKASSKTIPALIEAIDCLADMLSKVNAQAGTETIAPNVDVLLSRLSAAFTAQEQESSQNSESGDNKQDLSKSEPNQANKQSAQPTTEEPGIASKKAGDSPEERGQAQSNEQANPNRGSLRVDAKSMDKIVGFVGELFYVDERLKHLLAAYGKDSAEKKSNALLRNISQQFDVIMDHLYLQLIDVQKIPVLQVTRALERMVRQLSREQGKKGKLTVKGEHIRLDRQLIEALHDPLVHLVRNSMDHGVDTPEVRKAAGKNEEAQLEIDVHEGDEDVTVRITDDGKGIDLEKVRLKAVSKRMIDEKQAANMTKEQLIDLIFQPGFSTADRITDVSGRGVGMDVVISNIRRANGSVKVDSVPGKGTTVVLVLPKNSSLVIEGLVFRIGNVRYLLPFTALRRLLPLQELVKLRPLTGHLLANLDNTTLPIARVDGLYDDNLGNETNATMALLIEDRKMRQCILAADEVIGKQKVLIQPDDDILAQTQILSATFILGNGAIGFVLNVQNFMDQVYWSADMHQNLGKWLNGDEHEGAPKELIQARLGAPAKSPPS